MKFLYKIPAIIYRSFEDRGTDIPHFRALITMVFMLYMPAFFVALFFDGSADYIMPSGAENDRSVKFMYAMLYFAVLTIIFSVVFRETKLKKVDVSQKQIDRAKTIIPIYLTLCILVMTLLLVRRGVEKGTITL